MRAFLAVIVPLFASGGLAYAQEYPAKAVRIIVPFAPGGPNDLAVRPVAQKLHELLGQPFVIDYRAGANGIIGSELVAKSAPDGYTLLIISSSFTINASTYGIIAPAATPAATIARLQNAIAKALGTPDVRERYTALSLDPAASTAQDSQLTCGTTSSGGARSSPLPSCRPNNNSTLQHAQSVEPNHGAGFLHNSALRRKNSRRRMLRR